MKKTAVLLILCLTFLFLFSSCIEKEEYVMQSVETRIDIGLGHEFTVIHMSDSHLTSTRKGDSLRLKKLARSRQDCFNHQTEKLAYITKFSQEHNYPILHSGDLIDFITNGNLQLAENFLKNNGNDIIAYAPGNHEFCTNIGDPDDDTLAYKLRSIDKINQISPNDVTYFETTREGITFISIDDSYHVIGEEQLFKLKQSVQNTSCPVVLLMHAPLYEESLYNVMMNTSDSAYLVAVPEEKMVNYSEERIRTQKADKATLDAYNYILSESKIKVILAGHVHRTHTSQITENLSQYTVDTDVFRIVTFY